MADDESVGAVLYTLPLRPHSHTSHLPSGHQYSHDPLQQPHSASPASEEQNFSIIHTLKKGKVGVSNRRLARTSNASVLVEADGESIAELARCYKDKRQGRPGQ